MVDHDAAVFHKARHVKYFLRCLKTFLPGLYTSADSNRMLLGFFTIAGLDLLGVLQDETTTDERNRYIEWIYHCQLPSGGFRGFTGTDFGLERRTCDNEAWDPANIPATFFAIVTLIILGDDLTRVKRRECLEWLPRMQREDGSFGEVLGPDGRIEGGRDLRFCCFAAGTRYLLRGKDGNAVQDVEDIDVDRLVAFIQDCQVRATGLLSLFLADRLFSRTMVACRKRRSASLTVCLSASLGAAVAHIVQLACHTAPLGL